MKQLLYCVTLIGMLGILGVSCSDDDDNNPGGGGGGGGTGIVLSTTAISNISSSSASSGGNITSDGGSPIIARGVCWGTLSNPTTSNNFSSDGSGLGTYSSSITGLSNGVTYYVRAYAINANGTAYGNQLTFTTTNGNNLPSINLLGANPLPLQMRSSIFEPGFTANDVEDGNLTSSVNIDYSNVNMNLPGDYTAEYSVSDLDGNVDSASRIIKIYANANALIDTYFVLDTCGSGQNSVTYSYIQSLTAIDTATILFSKFADYSGNTNIIATIQPSGSIYLPFQFGNGIGSLNENHAFQGTGSVTLDGFVLYYTDLNSSAVPTISVNCRAYFYR